MPYAQANSKLLAMSYFLSLTLAFQMIFKKWKLGTLLALLLTSCSHPAPKDETATRTPASTGATTDEAILEFDGIAELVRKRKSEPGPSAAEARKHAEWQVQHLFGPMELGRKFGNPKAAPMGNHLLTNSSKPHCTANSKAAGCRDLEVRKKVGSSNVYQIFYHYKGNVVIEKGRADRYQVYLPTDPDQVFESAQVGAEKNEAGQWVSKCVDPEFPAKIEFWYFWSPAPAYGKCPLKKNVDYQIFPGQITRLSSVAPTYPDYKRLIEKDKVSVYMIYGKDDPDHTTNPMGRTIDIDARMYVEAYNDLKKLGFTVTDAKNPVSESEVLRRLTMRKNPALKDQGLPHLEIATKQFANGVTMEILMFYGQTEIDYQEHRWFHYALRAAAKDAALMIYDGHSGLGKSGSIAAIMAERGNAFKFEFNPKKYQIFYFNSCSSYAYYNAQFFNHKRPAAERNNPDYKEKNLVMVANGLSTDWFLKSDMGLVWAVHDFLDSGKWKSFQEIADDLDTGNLNIILGDENGPRRPY